MKKRFFLFFRLIVLISSLLGARGVYGSECFLQLVAFGSGAIKANGIAITGDKKYPLAQVLDNLNLSDYQQNQLVGKSVLSVGEGVSHLVPYLVSRDIKAVGLDLWYDDLELLPRTSAGHSIRAYVNQWRDHLVAGNAMDLHFDPDSFDMVVSHLLVNNFELQKDQFKIIDEALRVTKVGGEVRIVGLPIEIENWWRTALEVKYGSSIRFNLERKMTPDHRSSKGYREDLLLSIEKVTSKYSPLQW